MVLSSLSETIFRQRLKLDTAASYKVLSKPLFVAILSFDSTYYVVLK